MKVKAHSKDKHNRAVDKLAKQSAKNPLNEPLSVFTVRRKKSKKKTEIGSVPMLSQMIRIRIIDSKYLSVQKTIRYRYKVMSKRNKYFGKVDFFCSNKPLKVGHTYSVRFNSDINNPSLKKLYSEILVPKK